MLVNIGSEPRKSQEACRACASRGARCGVIVADRCRPVYLLGALPGTMTNGGCSPPTSAGPKVSGHRDPWGLSRA
jgi:hypothetical protein